MAAKILFAERQRFKQWWLWTILFFAVSIPITGLIRELMSAEPFADPEKNAGIFISLLIMAAVWALFFFLRLETQISETGISARLFPFHLKYQQFPWTEIDQVYVREYSAISEFGGWGLRYGLDGKAYNVSGNQGIQIVFKNGKKLLIGTNKPEAAAAALKQAQPVQA